MEKKKESKSSKRAREAREDRKAVEQFELLKERCQNQLDAALKHVKPDEIPLEEFASPKWDCRRCPLYTTCVVSLQFISHPKGWRFLWLEEEIKQ